MITLLLMLPMNCLFCIGIHIITNYEENEVGQPTDKMILWWLRYLSIKHIGIYWSKPLFLCLPCMASVWGTIFYFTFLFAFMQNITIFAFLIWPFYIVSLSGLNYVVSRYIDL